MRVHKTPVSLVMLVAICLLVVGCAAPAQPTQVPAATAVPVPATQAPEPVVKAAVPTTLNIASIHSVPDEGSWAKTWFEAWGRIAAQKPHGLEITYDAHTEEVWGDDAERVLREYAETGKYQIIWAHSSYSDQVNRLKDEYPEILWAVSGSGNQGIGGNVYWIYEHGHEGAYLLGILAGKMSKSGVIGYIGGFPADDVNDALNGFIDGAKSVNPNIKAKYTFIESWYDPPKAKEATLAQVAAGADFIYAERLGVFEACAEKGILCFGHFEDQNYMATDAVLSSTVIYWDPAAMVILEAWWSHVTEGKPYAAPVEPIWFSMREGGIDLAPFHGLADKVSAEALDAMNKAKQEIMDGKLVVPLKVDLPKLD